MTLTPPPNPLRNRRLPSRPKLSTPRQNRFPLRRIRPPRPRVPRNAAELNIVLPRPSHRPPPLPKGKNNKPIPHTDRLGRSAAPLWLFCRLRLASCSPCVTLTSWRRSHRLISRCFSPWSACSCISGSAETPCAQPAPPCEGGLTQARSEPVRGDRHKSRASPPSFALAWVGSCPGFHPRNRPKTPPVGSKPSSEGPKAAVWRAMLGRFSASEQSSCAVALLTPAKRLRKISLSEDLKIFISSYQELNRAMRFCGDAFWLVMVLTIARLLERAVRR
jgi:hypothetical protein